MEKATTEVTYNLDFGRVILDGGYEDDVTAEDEMAAANIAAGDGPKKKKRSKPQSQKAAVRRVSCQLQSMLPANTTYHCRKLVQDLKSTT